jgi:photosystem II stability/assembly factor-like uncharacterized protein
MKKLLLSFCLLFISVSVFAQWVQQTSGTNARLYSVYFTSSDTGYTVGGATILKTTDGGNIWNILSTTLGGASVFFTDANTGFVASGLNILKTNNAGASWSVILSGASDFLLSIYFPSSDTGYVVGMNGTILKTCDTGNTWTTLSSGISNNLYSVYFTDINTGYAVGNVGKIIKTSNGGANWTIQTIGTTNVLYSINFPNTDTGYAVGYDYTLPLGIILKTSDAGNTWTVLSSGTSNALRSVYFIPLQGLTNIGYTVGDNGTVLKTINSGMNWTAQTSGVIDSLFSIYIIPQGGANTGYAVGDHGKIIKTSNGGVFVEENQSKESVISIFPNPFSTSTTLQTTINLKSATLSIYNALGQEIKTINNISGKQITLQRDNLPEGIYFIRLTEDNETIATKKLMIN